MTMMRSVYLFLIITALHFSAAFAQEQTVLYSFSTPADKISLPDTLREISDLCLLDSVTLACIQDENGSVFFLEYPSGHIKRQLAFAGDGDYEGIACVNDLLYVLRSDGMIFEIQWRNKKTPSVKRYITGIPANDNEGLFYDEKNNRLLIACKSKKLSDPLQKNKRFIYAFDLSEKRLRQTPAFVFDFTELADYTAKKELKLPSSKQKKTTKKESPLRFAMSAVAIHPLNQDLYVLSAEDYLLLIYNQQAQLLHVQVLDPLLYKKAEGIAFTKNGDLLISNEGKGSEGNVLILPMKKD
jgi:uncharacterized protein YjiK